ncbi:MAG: CPBP family intramembrane metalloprotease [bacterium]|nr:MAG: CPBP family intramembrane metalloprotease [bacterium]
MKNIRPQSGLDSHDALALPHLLQDIFIVASPIIILGMVGIFLGLHTLAGGASANLGYLLVILSGGLLLRRQGSGWSKIGLGKPASWLKTVILGVGSWMGALLVFVGVQVIALGVINTLGLSPSEIDQSRFNQIAGNLPLFILMLILSWTTIAFGEELFYRAFLISRLLDQTALGRGWSILISGIVFGLVHFAEGPVGIFSNGAFGILFGWIYVLSGRNLWITIIGHGLLNTLRFAMLYTGNV